MTEELKPCPFRAHKKQKLKMHHRKCRWYEDGLYAIQCEICGIRGPYALGEKRAIERWNARAERTCQRFWTGAEMICSSCAHQLNNGTARYCPNCGARVVGTSQKVTGICDSEAVGE